MIDGIPYMEPDAIWDPTAAHFSSEFTVDTEPSDDFADEPTFEYLFYTRTGVDDRVYGLVGDHGLYPTAVENGAYTPDRSFLRGKTVLDAGCGGGRFLPPASEAAEYVVGLDLGSHVSRAAARSSRCPNVDVVQGSVLEPPFRPDAFDYVYSLGVLHHTPDPRRGALGLGSCVRPGGAMSVWVYPHDYWGRLPRSLISRLLHAFISRRSPERARRIAERWLLPLGQLQARLSWRRWTKLAAAPLFLISVPRHPSRSTMLATILDYYGPPIIHTHDPVEVESWFRDAGFEQVRSLPVPIAYLGEARRERPARGPASWR